MFPLPSSFICVVLGRFVCMCDGLAHPIEIKQTLTLREDVASGAGLRTFTKPNQSVPK